MVSLSRTEIGETYSAANVILARPVKGSALKDWALGVAKRAGMRKAKVALARKLAVVLHRMLTTGECFSPTGRSASATAAWRWEAKRRGFGGTPRRVRRTTSLRRDAGTARPLSAQQHTCDCAS